MTSTVAMYTGLYTGLYTGHGLVTHNVKQCSIQLAQRECPYKVADCW